jgi:LytS/YehU family sensor histidine kinase
MFNSLNAIQQMVLNGENEEAFRYLNTYSKLTRQILENSEKKWISVKDEIRFLDLYLKIESLRFDHAFSYQIEISDEVMPNKDLVPAMVIQPIVENAIKHGLMPRPGDKKLEVRFGRKEEGNMLEIQVEDNGVGRFAGSSEKKESDHKSMSLGITANRLQLLDATGKSKMDVTDLKDESGNSAGTLVKITISQPES